MAKKKRKTSKQKFQEQYDEIMSDYIDNLDRIDLVKVVWKDANTMSGTSGYQDIKERGLIIGQTIGYLVHEDEESISICGFLFPDPHNSILDPQSCTAFRDVHIIPKNCIQAIISLKFDFEESKKLRKRYSIHKQGVK